MQETALTSDPDTQTDRIRDASMGNGARYCQKPQRLTFSVAGTSGRNWTGLLKVMAMRNIIQPHSNIDFFHDNFINEGNKAQSS